MTCPTRSHRIGANRDGVGATDGTTAARRCCLSDVKPGDGRKETFRGYTYEQGWSAAVKVAGEHFEIQKQSKEEGIILGERAATRSCTPVPGWEF